MMAYLLFGEDDYVFAVFSTEEKAKKAADAHHKKFNETLQIRSYSLDTLYSIHEMRFI